VDGEAAGLAERRGGVAGHPGDGTPGWSSGIRHPRCSPTPVLVDHHFRFADPRGTLRPSPRRESVHQLRLHWKAPPLLRGSAGLPASTSRGTAVARGGCRGAFTG
jgi:hypothetical protein